MRRTLARMALFASGFLLLVFIVTVTNQTVQIVRAAGALSPVLGKTVLYVLLTTYAGLIGAPLVLYLRLPKPLTPPASFECPEFPHFLAILRKRLAKNPKLRAHPFTTQQDIEGAIAALDKDADKAVRDAASSVFVTTAICQSGRLDTLVVLITQTQLIWRVAHIYSQRGSFRDLINLYGNVAATALIAGDIEDIDLEPVLTAIFGSAASVVPGTRIVADSLVSGAMNAFLTLRVGMVAKRYCNCLVQRERRWIKKSATAEATKMLPILVKENGTRFLKAAGNSVANMISWPWVKSAKVGSDGL